MPLPQLSLARRLVSTLAISLLAACTMPSINADAGWACPCSDGWICDERTDVCVRYSAGPLPDTVTPRPGDDGGKETPEGPPANDAGSEPMVDAGPDSDASEGGVDVPGCHDSTGSTSDDTDGDGVLDCNDRCPNDPERTISDDTDGDGVLDCNDPCPDDDADTTGVDGDSDGTPDCHDGCPADPDKLQPGICGCGNRDEDMDGDGEIDCLRCQQSERCDGEDNDCDGIIDEVDDNGDGMHECQRVLVLGSNSGYSGLQSSNLLAWIAQNSPSMVEHGDGTITAELLAQTDVLIAQRLSRSYTAQEAALIRVWIEGGGAVFAMGGYGNLSPEDDTSTNALLAETGLRIVGQETSSALTLNEHPLTEGIQTIDWSGGREVGLEQGVSGGVNRVFLQNATHPLGIAQERGEGRAVLFGDEWISFFDTNEPEGDKRQFWRNLMNWLGGSTAP